MNTKLEERIAVLEYRVAQLEMIKSPVPYLNPPVYPIYPTVGDPVYWKGGYSTDGTKTP